MGPSKTLREELLEYFINYIPQASTGDVADDVDDIMAIVERKIMKALR